MPSASLLVRRTSGARAICLSRARANSVGCSDGQLPCIGSGGQPALAPAGGLRRLRPYRARRHLGAFVTSVAGVAFYELLAATGIGGGALVAPDWSLGLTLGIGGLVGTYAGARLQGYVPERLIRGVLGTLVTLLAIRCILWPTKF